MPPRIATVTPLALLLLAACAGPRGADVTDPPAATSEQRVLVKLSVAGVNAAPSAETVADWAARSAATPVRYAAAVSPGWHALALQCKPNDCDAALRRLALDTTHFDAIEPDAPRRALAPAAP